MNHDKLKDLLKQTAGNFERQPDCPDDYQLASYLDGGLSESDHSVFESHVADCDYCIERIGILGRAGESDSTIAMPGQAGNRSGMQSQWPYAPRWAAAALVVIAVGFLVGRQTSVEVTPFPEQSLGPSAVTERYVEQISPFPQILSPLEGSTVDLTGLIFKWKDVPDSLFYDIRIVSDDGGLITRERVWDTQWLLPEEIQLQAGAEYFVRVDAFVSEGKSVSSEHTLFKVAGK